MLISYEINNYFILKSIVMQWFYGINNLSTQNSYTKKIFIGKIFILLSNIVLKQISRIISYDNVVSSKIDLINS